MKSKFWWEETYEAVMRLNWTAAVCIGDNPKTIFLSYGALSLQVYNNGFNDWQGMVEQVWAMSQGLT